MRNRVRGSALAFMAVLIFSGVLLSQTAGPQRKASAPAPDLTGVWRRSRRPPDNTRQYTLGELVGSLGNEMPPMTPLGEAKFKTTKPNGGPRAVPLAETNDPNYKCFPPGVPRIYTSRLGAPFEIMQSPGRVTMIFEYDHFVRQFYTDGRPHPEDLSPTWMGDSVGKWEGNTLVVDTVGFNDKTWLDNQGHPHSDALHLVERIRRVSHDAMTDDITIDDPKAYTKPWVAHMIFELKPDWKIVEYVCEDFINFEGLQKTSETPK
jgi:hypothetical protein